MKNNEAFISKLRDEMLQIKERRFKIQIAKVTAIGSLIGVGSILIDKFEVTQFFYIVPFIAIAFDLFVIGESFTLKRIANFISTVKEEHDDAEFKWEQFVKSNPNKYSSPANSIITVLTALGSFFILFFKSNLGVAWFNNILNSTWFFVTLICLLLMFLVDRKLAKVKWNKPYDAKPSSPNKNPEKGNKSIEMKEN